MTKAFVLVSCEVDAVISVVEEIEGIEGVTDVNPVTGKYDVIIELEVDETEDLRDIVAGGIHGVDGIDETTTCVQT